MRSSESPGYAESGNHVLVGELVGKVFMGQQKFADPEYLKVKRKRRGDHSYEVLHIFMQRKEWGWGRDGDLQTEKGEREKKMREGVLKSQVIVCYIWLNGTEVNIVA